MSPLRKNEQSQRAGEIQAHTSDSRRRQQTENTYITKEREMMRGVKTSAEVVCGAGKRQTEAAYWAMAAPQAEMSQLGCLAAT